MMSYHWYLERYSNSIWYNTLKLRTFPSSFLSYILFLSFFLSVFYYLTFFHFFLLSYFPFFRSFELSFWVGGIDSTHPFATLFPKNHAPRGDIFPSPNESKVPMIKQELKIFLQVPINLGLEFVWGDDGIYHSDGNSPARTNFRTKGILCVSGGSTNGYRSPGQSSARKFQSESEGREGWEMTWHTPKTKKSVVVYMHAFEEKLFSETSCLNIWLLYADCRWKILRMVFTVSHSHRREFYLKFLNWLNQEIPKQLN